jgi:hypothetical protein
MPRGFDTPRETLREKSATVTRAVKRETKERSVAERERRKPLRNLIARFRNRDADKLREVQPLRKAASRVRGTIQRLRG